ncbi:MAG: BON domain-containing protein [Gammaproteobacteria bacterium]
MRIKTNILIALLLAAGLVCAVGGCASNKPMPGATAGSFMDDSYLTTTIKAKLLADTWLKSFDIHVKTVSQVVTLSGTVPTTALRDQAVTVAKGVGGVKDVVSEIEVKSP